MRKIIFLLLILLSVESYGQKAITLFGATDTFRISLSKGPMRLTYYPGDSTKAFFTDAAGNLFLKTIESTDSTEFATVYSVDTAKDNLRLFEGFGVNIDDDNKINNDTLLMATRYDLDNIGITLADTTVFEGSSLTLGYLNSVANNLPIDTNHTMPAYVSKSTNTVKINNATSGATLRNITRRFFTNNPATDVTTSLILEGGLNDLRGGGTGLEPGANIEICIGENIRCLINNHFLDTVVAISDATIIKTGSWTELLPSDSTITSKSRLKSLGYPMTSSTAGDKIEFDIFTGGEPIIIGTYYVQDTTTNNFGSYSITVDGEYYGSDTVQGKGSNYFRAPFGTFLPQRPATFMITGLDSGVHTIELELEQSKQVDFDYIGVLADPSNCEGIIVSEIPYTLRPAAALASTIAKVDATNNIIDTIITRFKNLHYPVELAPITSVIPYPSGYATDSLHFSNLGHMMWAKTIFSKVNTNQRISLLTSSGSLDNALDTLVPRYGLTYTDVSEGSPAMLTKRVLQVDTVAVSTKLNVIARIADTSSVLRTLVATKQNTLTISFGLALTGSTLTNNLATGIAGGQTIYGGTASGEDMTITSTTHGVKGDLIFGNSKYDEANNRLGIGQTPAEELGVTGSIEVRSKSGSDNVYVRGINSAGTTIMEMKEASSAGLGGTYLRSIRPTTTGNGWLFEGYGNAGFTAHEFSGVGGTFASPLAYPSTVLAKFTHWNGSATIEDMLVGTNGLTVNAGVQPGSGMKHQRVTTGSIGAGASALVTLTWTTAFANANYTPVVSVTDATAATAALRIVHIESVTASTVVVRVENTSAGSLTGTLNVIAMHD